ncbi:MAG: hypothetical protein IH905_09930 [Proteobacteria bacterium]|nr:hypothetical protein [Pseudomonadota bacterium]
MDEDIFEDASGCVTEDDLQVVRLRQRVIILQAWLTENLDQHLASQPPGDSEWLVKLVEFDVLERGHLRNVYHDKQCIHGEGRRCPKDTPVCCTPCEEPSGGRRNE